MKKNEKLLRRLLAEYMWLVYCTFNINNHKAEIVSKKFWFIQWLLATWRINLWKWDEAIWRYWILNSWKCKIKFLESLLQPSTEERIKEIYLLKGYIIWG